MPLPSSWIEVHMTTAGMGALGRCQGQELYVASEDRIYNVLGLDAHMLWKISAP